MKRRHTHINYLLTILWLLPLAINAQTPYDSFAPEATRPMICTPAERWMQKVLSDSVTYTLAVDVQNRTLYLINEQTDSLEAMIRVDQNNVMWLSVDPLADKYIDISPYVYCIGNPIRLVDPNGMDVYRYDNETGNFYLYQKTDDDYDQVGKFKYNKKTGEYEPKMNKDGTIRTYSDRLGNNDKIAKGILRDGLNIKQEGARFISNNNLGPTLTDLYIFALILDEIAGVEIAGFVLEPPSNTTKRLVQIEPYKDNTYNRSKTRIQNFTPYNVLVHFHTHGQAKTEAEARTPSQLDLNFKNNTASYWYPCIQLIILNNYESPIEY